MKEEDRSKVMVVGSGILYYDQQRKFWKKNLFGHQVSFQNKLQSFYFFFF